uniref:Boule-like protein 1 n=1 Tax=Isodiametra pulchra TaxID=504439 RepID=S4S5S3_ISOPU|nr:boule-like protein 1 [Isodiametra pulchra]
MDGILAESPPRFRRRYSSSSGVLPNAISAAAAKGKNNFGTIIHNRVFIGGLHESVTEADLSAKFQHYGKISDIKIVKKPEMEKGYGFITFEMQDDASKLLEQSGTKVRINGTDSKIGPAIRRSSTSDQIYTPTAPPAPNCTPASGRVTPGPARDRFNSVPECLLNSTSDQSNPPIPVPLHTPTSSSSDNSHSQSGSANCQQNMNFLQQNELLAQLYFASTLQQQLLAVHQQQQMQQAAAVAAAAAAAQAAQQQQIQQLNHRRLQHQAATQQMQQQQQQLLAAAAAAAYQSPAVNERMLLDSRPDFSGSLFMTPSAAGMSTDYRTPDAPQASPMPYRGPEPMPIISPIQQVLPNYGSAFEFNIEPFSSPECSPST